MCRHYPSKIMNEKEEDNVDVKEEEADTEEGGEEALLEEEEEYNIS